MAENELEIILKWENNNFFEMTSKLNQEPVISIIKVEENSRIKSLSSSIQALCNTYFREELEQIMKEMEE